MQCSDGSCGANQNTSYIKESGVSPTITVKGITGPDKVVTNTFSAKYNDPLALKIPNSMAGGGNIDNQYNFIQHPTNKRKYSLQSKMGQSILKKYLKNN